MGTGYVMQRPPDFYLASTERDESEEPRAGYVIKRLRGPRGDDYMLARIEPPMVAGEYGIDANDIGRVILATRHVGSSLFPILSWPVFVHVARPLFEHPEERDAFQDGEVQVVDWAALYETKDAARKGLG